MCGIVGRTGDGNSVPYILNGLLKLEYRGYDSAGLAVLSDEGMTVLKAPGRLCNLKKRVLIEKPEGNTAIGHTRWATHGEPNEANAHPHMSAGGRFALVHNGIIENYRELKELLPERGRELVSVTDTEVAVQLIEGLYKGDAVEAISKAGKLIKGSYAFGIICTDYPGTLFCTAAGSPLAAAADGNEALLASDPGVLRAYTEHAYRITGGDICVLTQGEARFFDSEGEPKEVLPFEISSDSLINDKGGYPHYMLLEIMQQPEAVENTLSPLMTGERIDLSGITLGKEFSLNGIENAVIVACGSAYNAGLVGERLLENLAKLPCAAKIASEFRYSEPLINERTLAVFISQSGETADTLAALRLAKEKGARILSIVNVRGSVIASESEFVIYTRAGRETAVATTKAYSAQLSVLYALALFAGESRGKLSDEKYKTLFGELKALPGKMREAITGSENGAAVISEELCKVKSIFFLGRQLSFAAAAEGSLKMKEISYIHSEAYPAGELKHGTIALIERASPVIAVIGSTAAAEKTLSNLSEVQSRGARVFAVTPAGQRDKTKGLDGVITVPDTAEEFSVSLLVIPLQLMSYRTALLRGCDIDKPKNLAKSVTVE